MEPETTTDPRPPALGVARVLMAGLALFSAWVFLASLIALGDAGIDGIVDVIVSVVWVAIAAGVIHNGTRMRMLAWGGLAFQLCCFVIVSACGEAAWARQCRVWYDAGAAYWWLPAFFVLVTSLWMIISDPRRLAGRSA